MAAAQQVFPLIEQGATFSYNFYFKNKSDNSPINFTSCSAKMQIRATVDSPTVIVELSSANGRILIEALTGKLIFLLAATETSALQAGKFVYDLEITFQDNSVRRMLEGKVVIKPEVTR